MDLLSRHADAINIITVNETRIDASVVIGFKDAIRRLTANGPTRVVLDLSQVQFVDSSGLGAIVAPLKQMPDGYRLELAGLTGGVGRVFRLTRMDTIFAIHENIDAALEHAAV